MVNQTYRYVLPFPAQLLHYNDLHLMCGNTLTGQVHQLKSRKNITKMFNLPYKDLFALGVKR